MNAIEAEICLMTVDELASRWLQESLGVFNAETLELYRGLLENHVAPVFGEKETVSREEMLAFREEKLAQGISEGTVYTIVRLLGRILEYGASIGECPSPEWAQSLGTPKRSRDVAVLPQLKETTVQAIRRRVTHGFEKLNRRLDDIYAVEGWDAVGMLERICERLTGPKGNDSLEKRCKKALEALDRLQAL